MSYTQALACQKTTRDNGWARFSQLNSLVSSLIHASSAVVFECPEPTRPFEVVELHSLQCQTERFTQSVTIPSTTLGALASSIPIDIADESDSEPESEPENMEDFELVEVDSLNRGHRSRSRACLVDGKPSCFWSLACTLAPHPGTVYCHSRGQVVRDHAAILGQSLRTSLLLDTRYAGAADWLCIRQATVSWKPASTPWEHMHFDRLRSVLASDLVLWAVDTEYLSLPQASVCVVSIAIRDYLMACLVIVLRVGSRRIIKCS
jgi:hypothetical protein